MKGEEKSGKKERESDRRHESRYGGVTPCLACIRNLGALERRGMRLTKSGCGVEWMNV